MNWVAVLGLSLACAVMLFVGLLAVSGTIVLALLKPKLERRQKVAFWAASFALGAFGVAGVLAYFSTHALELRTDDDALFFAGFLGGLAAPGLAPALVGAAIALARVASSDKK